MTRKTVIRSIFLLSTFLMPFTFVAQENKSTETKVDSLSYYTELDSLAGYIKCIKRRISTFAKADKKGKFEFLEDNPLFREPIRKEEFDLTRWYYASKFYQFRNFNGNIVLSNRIGLKAAEYAMDTMLLDRRAYFIEFELGNNYSKLDDHTRALYYLNKCLPGAIHRKNYKLENKCYLEIGAIHRRLGDYSKARQYILKARDVPYEGGISNELAINEKYRLLSLETKDGEFLMWVDKERRLLEKYKEHSDYNTRKKNLNLSVGNYYQNEGNWQKAIAYYRKSIAYYEKYTNSLINRNLAKVYVKIAECQHQLGDDAALRSSLSTGFGFLIPDHKGVLMPHDSLLFAENTLGSLCELGFDYFKSRYEVTKKIELLDTAYQFIKLGIATNNLINRRLFYSSGKFMSTDLGRNRVNSAFDLLWQLKDTLRPDYYKNEVDYLLNQSKDNILKDQIDLKSKMSMLDSISQRKAQRLLELIVSAAIDNDSQHEIVKYQTELDQLLEDEESAALVSAREQYSLDYLITDKNVYLSTHLPGAHNLALLGQKQDLNKRIDTFLHSIKNREVESVLQQKSSHLREFLIPDSIDLPFEFTIIPDGIISLVPFDLLMNNDSYLIENHLISTKSYTNDTKLNSKNKIQKVLCVHPIYQDNETISVDDLDRGGYYALPFSQYEVDDLRGVFKEQMHVHNYAKSKDILEELSNSDIFHFAGHAKATDSSSYLVLKDQDKLMRWNSEQIYHANLDLELVTLSACETGLGEIKNGDGVNSIARSFLSAGAKSAIYSLWTVNDKSTSQIMTKVYHNLAEGAQKHAAVRNAKLAFLSNANPQLRHPYYWGGFTVTGDLNPLVMETYSIKLSAFLAIGAICFLILFLFIKTKHL